MKTVEVLRQVRELISVPAKWIQGEYARDGGTGWVDPKDPEAACFCVVGALSRVTGLPILDVEGQGKRTPHPAFVALKESCGMTPSFFNDHSSHAQVVDWIDRTIAEIGNEG